MFNTITEKYNNTVGTFKDNYVAYNLNTNYEANKKLYDRDTGSMNKILSLISTRFNDLKMENIKLDENIDELINLIDDKKNKNQLLEKKSNELINSDLASTKMAKDVLEVFYYSILFILCNMLLASGINIFLYRLIYVRK